MGFQENDSGGGSWVVRQRGAVVIKILVLIPIIFVLALVLVLAFYEARKAYWDYRVERMCEDYGGVFIKKKTRINVAERKSLGVVGGYTSIPPKSLADATSPIFYVYKETAIRESNPRVTKWEETIHRRSDNSVVAQVIQFRRSGGDFPTFAHPSRFVCPSKLEILAAREEIFQK